MMDVKCDSTHVSSWESLDTYQLAGDAMRVEKSLETVAVWEREREREWQFDSGLVYVDCK